MSLNKIGKLSRQQKKFQTEQQVQTCRKILDKSDDPLIKLGNSYSTIFVWRNKKLLIAPLTHARAQSEINTRSDTMNE